VPRDPRRPDRVAEAVREEIAALLAGGVKDPRVSALVTVTVYGSDRERDETMAGLDAVAPSLRGRVGRALRLRLAPSIHFKFDESFARATRIENLLASIKPAPDGVTPAPDASDDAATEEDERGN